MVICPDCNKEFKTGQALAGHARFKHGKTGKLKWKGTPETHLITQGEFFQLLCDKLGEAIKANAEFTEQVYASCKEMLETDTSHLRKLVELNHEHCDANSKDIQDVAGKLVGLIKIINNHIEWTKNQFTEQEATMTDLAEVVKDLVARIYGREEAHT